MEKITHKLNIAREEYRIVSEESPEYMKELAREVDLKMAAILKNARISTTQAAVLVALQYASEAKKSGGDSDTLRAEIKACLEDSAQAKSERDLYKRELERLRAQLEAENGSTGNSQGSLWR